jgi:hypothetical protein
VAVKDSLIQELAKRPYSKERYPEAPYQVHQERQQLAKQVLDLRMELQALAGRDDSADDMPSVYPAERLAFLEQVLTHKTKELKKARRLLQRLEGRLQQALAGAQVRRREAGQQRKGWRLARLALARAERKAAKAQQRAEKALQQARQALKRRQARVAGRRPLQRGARALGPKHRCLVKGCNKAGLWKLCCQHHLSSLPPIIRKVLLIRPTGAPGRASLQWLAAAEQARKLLVIKGWPSKRFERSKA